MMIVSTLVTGVVLGAVVEPVRADDCPGGGRRGRRCSTPPSSSVGKALTARMLAGARRLRPGERIVVPVVYHVIYDTYVPEAPGVEPDDLEHAPPVALVELQTATLNRAFQGTAFSFSTAEVQLRSFAPWRRRGQGYPPLDDVVKMIRDLNAERRRVLHVFLMRKDEETAAPPDTRRMFAAFRRPTDGILMPWDYLPYEPSLRPVEDPLVPVYYHQGETLVHLVGHYLGLLHTYEPWPAEGRAECTTKCAQISDHVRDTPVHVRNPTFPACLVLDTCPQYPGRDPVRNYMNAEPDVCSSEFTTGQLARMERMVRAFRPYFIVAAPAAQP
jgi:hypothetical protein